MPVTLPHYGWHPRNDQLPFWKALLNPDIDTVVMAAHRRWGKDECVLHWEAIYGQQRVGTLWHALPQYNQCRKAIWEAVNPRTGRRRIFDAFPTEMIEHLDEQSMRIRFKNQSVWQLIGSDQTDSLVGTSPISISYSEAAIAEPKAFGFFRPILAENKGKQIFISTPRGRNDFHRILLAHKGQPRSFTQVLSAEDTSVFTPEQLLQERREMIAMYGDALGNAFYEQEYLCAFDSAIVGAVFGPELATMEKEGRVHPVAYDSRYPVYTSWDLGVRDTTVILFWQIRGERPYLIDWYAANDIGFEHFAEVLASKPYYYSKHIGPHDVAERSKATAVSYAAYADSLGVRFERMPRTGKTEQIAAASILLKQVIVNADLDNPPDNKAKDCGFLLETFKQYAFAFDDKTKLLSRAPTHNWTSHYADALQTFALYFVGSHARTRASSALNTTQALQGRTADPRRLKAIHEITRGRRTGAFG